MRIRWKIISGIILTIGVIFLILHFSMSSFVLRGYPNLEIEMGKDLNRGVSLLQQEIEALGNVAIKEAHWDEAYKFVQKPNRQFIESDMLVLEDLELDFLAYVGLDGKVVFGKHLEAESGEEQPLPAGLKDNIESMYKNWHPSVEDGGSKGLVLVESKPLIMVHQPILTSKGKGPVKGTLVIGRWFDSHSLAELGHRAKLPLKLLPYTNAFPNLSIKGVSVEIAPDQETLLGQALLNDLNGDPILTLVIEVPRITYLQGVRNVRYFIYYFLAVSLLSSLIIYVFIDKWLSNQEHHRNEIEHLAYHDNLTGLPNRLMLQEYIKKTLSNILRENKCAALLFMDLDRFKLINDTYGHTIGDALLISVARWLTSHVRSGDMVARIGGDEFVIFLSTIHNHHEALSVVEKLLEIRENLFEVSENPVFVTSSIGIAMFPEDATDFETLLRMADMSMHEAKVKGCDGYQFTSKEINTRFLEYSRIEADIPKALYHGEFHMVYQPQFDLDTHLVTGVEALLRWRHPEKGALSPDTFIPIAEESGLIHAIGEWVLRAVCRQIADWQLEGIPPLRVSINFSGLELIRPDFISMVDAILAETGVNPTHLEFELTESVIMDGNDIVQRLLEQLRERGISLAIDDFGTGYSSLKYLQNFPIQRIKIDKSFIRDIVNNKKDMELAKAIITMASSMQMEIIAEGVETAEQLELLKSHGCMEVQGFYFAHPMAAQDILNFSPSKELFSSQIYFPEDRASRITD